MTLLPLSLLFALLAAAVFHDVRARRIPNALVFPGMLAALVLHTTPLGGLGLLQSLGGLGLGLALLLPMYALRAMGAGDVKLLAMVGAFVGLDNILAVGLASLLAGGVLALAFAAWARSLRSLVGNAYHMALHTAFSSLAGNLGAPMPAPASASGRLPYAIAIATGTALCVAWQAIYGALPL